MRLPSLLLLISSLPLFAATPAEPDAFEPAAVAGARAGWRPDISQREAVRLFYQVRYKASPASGYWRGSLADCQPGELLPSHRSAMLDRINWFRAMAGVPADLEEDPAASRKMQAAALAVAANGRIAHQIDGNWRCYSDEAREGASNGLLSSGETGPEAVTSFMRDPGIQNAGVNHRRWLLYPQTRFVGLGDIPQADKRLAASGFSAYDGLYAGNRPPVRDEFVAWPPPGWVPYPLVFARWSLSLPDADFSAAKVSLSLDGVGIPLLQEVNERGAGEPTLVWRPINLAAEAGWPQPRGDSHYRVEIVGISQGGRPRQIAYEVHVFDPAQDGPAGPQGARVQGLARIPVEGGAFTIALPTGATGAQWRALKLADFPLDEGAEAGHGAFSYGGSNDYPVLQQRVLASGKQAFRLAHNHISDEVLTLVGQLAPGPRASLHFKQRLGIAGTGEEARVEARVVGSDAWEALYQRRANGQMANADRQFSEQRVDLGAYAGKLIELRFRYQFAQGDFYPPDDDRVGWYLDDIRLEQTSRVLFAGEPLRSGGNGFRFLPEQKGEWRLQARPTVYSAPGDWGPLWPVTVE